eukprot:763689-Hanusia_phi.AAC.1
MSSVPSSGSPARSCPPAMALLAPRSVVGAAPSRCKARELRGRPRGLERGGEVRGETDGARRGGEVGTGIVHQNGSVWKRKKHWRSVRPERQEKQQKRIEVATGNGGAEQGAEDFGGIPSDLPRAHKKSLGARSVLTVAQVHCQEGCDLL